MPVSLTVGRRQEYLVNDLAATTADVTWLRDRVQYYWAQFADRDTIIPYLTDQYVKRRMAQVLLGPLRLAVDGQTADQSVKQHQQIDTLTSIIADATAEIVRLEAKARKSRTGAAQLMTPPVHPYPVLPLRDERSVVPTPFDERVLPWPGE